MVYDLILRGKSDAVVEELLEQTTGVLEGVVDESWVLWVKRLIPNVAHQVREEAEAKMCKEQERLIHKGMEWLLRSGC